VEIYIFINRESPAWKRLTLFSRRCMADLPVPQICAGLPAHIALQSDSVARRAGLTVISIRRVHEYAGEILTSITTVALELLVMMFSFQH
jgi:hypothetical protein